MNSIRPEFVDFIPALLSPGVLYISERYRTASHLCACGCGEKILTPLSPTDWQLISRGRHVSLYPSIGNWNYACRSHYWIRRNKIVWSGRMSATSIARIQERDRLDKARYVEQRNRQKLARSTAPEARLNLTNRKSPSLPWRRVVNWIARFLNLS